MKKKGTLQATVTATEAKLNDMTAELSERVQELTQTQAQLCVATDVGAAKDKQVAEASTRIDVLLEEKQGNRATISAYET